MTTFYCWAKTKSGSDIGRVKIETDTEFPLDESDVLIIEEKTDEVGF